VAIRTRRAFVVAVALATIAGIYATFVAATSSSDAETMAVPVSATTLASLTSAASSCPSLTAAKLAGQVMAESSFSTATTTVHGGVGIAGLTDAEWQLWRPSVDAVHTDNGANILALSHFVCDLVGQLRVAKVPGDPWEMAVAAYHSGVPAVTAAAGIPADAASYVTNVVSYAQWYGGQPGFTATGLPAPDPSVSSTTVPAPTPTRAAAAATSGSGPTSVAPPPQPQTTTPQSAPTTATAPPTQGILWNQEFNGCLSADKALNGSHLVVVACDGSAAQLWQPMADGTIRAAGMCMDAQFAQTANFTPVQVANCSGNLAQLFTLTSSGHLYSPYANKCVNIDVSSGVVLYTCLDQTNQLFELDRQP
jgi:hypothetical protein